jgi:phosphoribosylformylglycinamidine synthase PurS subunit
MVTPIRPNQPVCRLLPHARDGPPAASAGTSIITDVKAHVYVTLKTSVLDPQGQTIQNALKKIGFSEVEAVRQGKYFALSLADGLAPEQARAVVERIAREVLTNPVIEEFTYSISE